MSRHSMRLLIILGAALAALPTAAKKEHPKLLPPDGLSKQEEERALRVCAHEGWGSAANGLASPGEVALARMGGRSSRGFIDFSLTRGMVGYANEGALPVVDPDGHHPVGTGREWSHDSHKKNISDRYVLCLLAMGFRWADDPPPPPRGSPLFASAARAAPSSQKVRDPLVSEGIEACRAGDHATALRRFVGAAEQGDVEGQFLAGTTLLLWPTPGADRPVPSGPEWLRKAADQGNADASYTLSILYEEGREVEKDQVEAARRASAAAIRGHAGAQRALGWMYRYGMGMPVDYVEAVGWQRLAAEQGDVLGLENLGIHYQHGLGVKKDATESCRLYGLAAEKGYVDCEVRFADCLLDTDNVSHDIVLALAWLAVASASLPPGSDLRKAVDGRRRVLSLRLSSDEVSAVKTRREEIRSRLAAIPPPDYCADPNALHQDREQ